MGKTFSISFIKLLLFFRYLNACPDFFGDVGKWLVEKAKNVNIYGIINWEANNYTYCPMRWRQSENEILSVTIIKWEIFLLNDHAENEAGRLAPNIYFTKKPCIR